MIEIRRAALLLSLAFAAPAQERVERVHDLRGLIGAALPARGGEKQNGVGLVLPFEMPLASVSAEAEPRVAFFGYPDPCIRSSVLLDRLGRLFGEGEESELTGGRLHLRDVPAVHDRVRDLLGALEERVHSQLELELHFFLGAFPVAEVVLDAAATRKLLESRAPDASYRQRITGDVPARVRSATQQHFVRDYDVEVATKTVMYDPKVDTLFEGLHAGILATMLADGRVHLTFSVQESELARPMKVLKLRGADQGQLHQPSMRSRTIAGTGILELGGALVLGAVSEPWGVCLLRVKRAAPPQQVARTGRFQAVPLGDMMHPVPRFIGARRPSNPGAEPILAPEPETESGESWFAALEQIVGEPDPEVGRAVIANHLLVRRSEKGEDRIGAKLREWAAARRTFQLRVRAGRVGAEEARRYLRGGTEPSAFVGSIPVLGSVAVVPDRSFLIMQGVERKFVRDYDVEIAQSAQAANPVMGTAFSGISFSGSLTPVSGGASLTGRFLLANTAFETLDTDMARARDLDVLRSPFVEQEFTAVRLRGDEWTVLLVQPTREKDYAVLAVRVAK